MSESATWSATVAPRTRREQRAACRRLRQDDPVLRQIYARQLGEILEPLWAEQVTPADIRYMINHRPDGTPHFHTDGVFYAPGWLRRRLAHWHDEHGRLLVDELPSRRAAAAREADRLAAAERAAEREQALARRADAARHIGAVRASTAAAGPRAAEALRRAELHASTYAADDRERAAERAERYARLDEQAAAAVARLALVEPDEVFRRDVTDRHTPPAPAVEAEQAPAADYDADADRAWLVAMMAATS